MEVRIENSVQIVEIEFLKKLLNNFFETDFQIVFKGDYVYFRDKT